MDRLRLGRRSVLGGVVAALGSMAGCVWDEGDGGDDADSTSGPTPEYGYGGKPVVDDRTEDRQVDESDDDRDRDRSGGGGTGSTIVLGGGGGDDGGSEPKSTLGVGEQRYGEEGYGGVKLDDGEDSDGTANETASENATAT